MQKDKKSIGAKKGKKTDFQFFSSKRNESPIPENNRFYDKRLHFRYLSIYHELKELHLSANGDEICYFTDQSVFPLPFHFSLTQNIAD